MLFKFFKGKFTEEIGYKDESNNVGRIHIEGDRKRTIIASNREGWIHNNFIWFYFDEDSEYLRKRLRQKALYRFKDESIAKAKSLRRKLKLNTYEYLVLNNELNRMPSIKEDQ